MKGSGHIPYLRVAGAPNTLSFSWWKWRQEEEARPLRFMPAQQICKRVHITSGNGLQKGMKDCVDLLTMNRLFWKFWKPIGGGDQRSRSGQLHQRQCRSSCESWRLKEWELLDGFSVQVTAGPLMLGFSSWKSKVERRHKGQEVNASNERTVHGFSFSSLRCLHRKTRQHEKDKKPSVLFPSLRPHRTYKAAGVF